MAHKAIISDRGEVNQGPFDGVSIGFHRAEREMQQAVREQPKFLPMIRPDMVRDVFPCRLRRRLVGFEKAASFVGKPQSMSEVSLALKPSALRNSESSYSNRL
jgi:hypothetical protein